MKVDVKVEATLFDEGYGYADGGSEYEDHSVEALVIAAASSQLAEKINESLIDQMCKNLEGTIQANIDTTYQQAISERLQSTNQWGELKGEPTTLREIIIQYAESWFNEKVDSKTGKPAERYNRNQECTRMEYFVKQMVREICQETIGAELKRVDKLVRADMTDLVANIRGYLKSS